MSVLPGRKAKDIVVLMTSLGFKFEDKTMNGHLRWRHIETGAILVSGSKVSEPRTLQNLKSEARKRIAAARVPNARSDRPPSHGSSADQ